MKEFERVHLLFPETPKKFTELSPPEWMVSQGYLWWWVGHVLTLEIGQSIETDFHKITRTA